MGNVETKLKYVCSRGLGFGLRKYFVWGKEGQMGNVETKLKYVWSRGLGFRV
jgi:hypothetical protein